MAKKPKQASAEGGEAGADAAPKGKKKLMIIVAAAVLVLILGGGGAFMMMGRGDGKDVADGGHGGDHGGGHGGGHGGDAAGPDGKKPVVFVDVRELLLNLSPESPQDKAKYAKVRLALELKDAKVEEEVKPLMPRVEDALQVYMRELRASDITSSVGLFRLREELLRRINIALYPARVEAVLFKDVIVQ